MQSDQQDNESTNDPRRSSRLAGKKREQQCQTIHRSPKRVQKVQKSSLRTCVNRDNVHMQEFILLKIFEFLNEHELVYKAGHVCRTWRKVTRDPSLWKDKELCYPCFVPNPVQHAQGHRLQHNIQILTIAPKLRDLSLNYFFSSSVLYESVSLSRCQVSSLYGEFHSELDFISFLNFLGRQKCLEKLRLFGPRGKILKLSLNSVQFLWRVVQEMGMLKELKVRYGCNLFEVAYEARPLKPMALQKILVLDCNVSPYSALDALVEASFKSLRVLELPQHMSGGAMKTLPLKNCVNVNSLCIPCLQDIVAIQNFCHLEILEIFERSGACCKKEVPIIQSMPNLRELTINRCYGVSIKNIEVLFCKVPNLEKLDCLGCPQEDVVNAIVSGLLPALKELILAKSVIDKSREKLVDLKARRVTLKIPFLFPETDN